MDYKLNYELFSGVFAVPNIVTDMYVAEASGMYIKVLLVIIRNSENPPAPEQIGKLTNLSTQDVNEAVSYWAAKGLLTDKNTAPQNSAPKEDGQAPEVQVISPKPSKLALGDISKRIDNDAELRFLLTQTEVMIGKTLNSTEQRSLIYLYEETQLPADVILMAVDLSLKRDKSDIRYIRKVCENWSDLGISNHEMADAHIKEQLERDSHYNKASSVFGIRNRNLTTREKAYIDTWFGEYRTQPDMLARAYEICVDATGKVSFPYIDKVLRNWKDDGISDLKDTALSVKPSKKSAKQRIVKETSFDLDEFEARGLDFVKRK